MSEKVIRSHPNLQLDPLVISVDRLHLKVDAHCADESRSEGIIGIAEQKAGLSHAAVADDQDLEHVVEVLVRGLLLSITVICSRGHLEGEGGWVGGTEGILRFYL